MFYYATLTLWLKANLCTYVHVILIQMRGKFPPWCLVTVHNSSKEQKKQFPLTDHQLLVRSIRRRNNPLKWCNLWYVPQINLRSRTVMENANSTFTHKHHQGSLYHSSIRIQQQLKSIYKRRISSSFLWSGGINSNSFQRCLFFLQTGNDMTIKQCMSPLYSMWYEGDSKMKIKRKKKNTRRIKVTLLVCSHILRTKEMETEK